MSDFVKAEGLIHFVPPVMGSEHTLCGDAFDLDSDEDGYEWEPTKATTVTCPRCASVIRACQGIKTRASA